MSCVKRTARLSSTESSERRRPQNVRKTSYFVGFWCDRFKNIWTSKNTAHTDVLARLLHVSSPPTGAKNTALSTFFNVGLTQTLPVSLHLSTLGAAKTTYTPPEGMDRLQALKVLSDILLATKNDILLKWLLLWNVQYSARSNPWDAEHHVTSVLLYPTLLYPSVLCCILLYATLRYNFLSYSTLLYLTLLYSPLLYSALLYLTLLYATLLYSNFRYSTLTSATLLYLTLRYSTLLYFTRNF